MADFRKETKQGIKIIEAWVDKNDSNNVFVIGENTARTEHKFLYGAYYRGDRGLWEYGHYEISSVEGARKSLMRDYGEKGEYNQFSLERDYTYGANPSYTPKAINQVVNNMAIRFGLNNDDIFNTVKKDLVERGEWSENIPLETVGDSLYSLYQSYQDNIAKLSDNNNLSDKPMVVGMPVCVDIYKKNYTEMNWAKAKHYSTTQDVYDYNKVFLVRDFVVHHSEKDENGKLNRWDETLNVDPQLENPNKRYGTSVLVVADDGSTLEYSRLELRLPTDKELTNKLLHYQDDVNIMQHIQNKYNEVKQMIEQEENAKQEPQLRVGLELGD